METSPTIFRRQTARLAYQIFDVLRTGQAKSDAQQRWCRRALAYYVSPWDLIPDLIPGVGLLDDALVLLAINRWLKAYRVTIPKDLDPITLKDDIRHYLYGTHEVIA